MQHKRAVYTYVRSNEIINKQYSKFLFKNTMYRKIFSFYRLNHQYLIARNTAALYKWACKIILKEQ